VRVPDDLSVPDESNSLRLPPEEGAGGPARRDCLEAPPPFFQDSRLGDQQANPAEQPPTGQQPAEQPPEPAEDPERQIGN
jgi:hypothetical protein